MRHLLAAALYLTQGDPSRAQLEERAWNAEDRRLAHLCSIIETQARAYHLDEMWLLAIAWEESRLNPNAVGKRGRKDAYGLFQVRLPTVRSLARKRRKLWSAIDGKQLLHPATNTAIAAWILADLVKRKGSQSCATMAWAGTGPRARAYDKRVERTWVDIISFRAGLS